MRKNVVPTHGLNKHNKASFKLKTGQFILA